MNNINIDGCKVLTKEARIIFPVPVERVLEFNSKLIVLLEPGNDATAGQNVRAFTTDGERLWTIDGTESPAGDENDYVRIWIDDGELWAGDWKGVDYRIDLETGNHIERRFSR